MRKGMMKEKERAIKILCSYLPKDEPMNVEDREAFFIAIESLKQEPILDKIRAEVIEKAKCTMNDTRAEGLYMALQIIDKYRGEEDETDN